MKNHDKNSHNLAVYLSPLLQPQTDLINITLKESNTFKKKKKCNLTQVTMLKQGFCCVFIE